jgi:glycosyltransferase involved in cell wall biosynthesis
VRVGVFLDNRTPTTGGGFSFQDSILQALLSLRTDHDLYLFCSGPKIPTPGPRINVVTVADQRRAGLISKTIRITRQVRKDLHRRLKKEFDTPLKRMLKEHGIEILWFPTPADEETNIPYIYTVWDLQHRIQPFFPEVGAPVVWRNTERMYKNMIPRASFIVTGTNVGKKEIVEYYRVPEARVRVIALPVPELPIIQDDTSASTQNLADRKYLFYPAQFWPHKNHVVLLHALKALNDELGLDFDLVFTGSDQGNLSYVRSVADQLGLQKNVRFLGFVDRASIVALYRNAFALVFPSLFGPDNLPPLEAFALGCPVIAGKIPGAEEQLGKAALLVAPKDEREIAQAVARLDRTPGLRQSLIESGLRRARRSGAEGYVQSVIKIIDEFESIRRCWGA